MNSGLIGRICSRRGLLAGPQYRLPLASSPQWLTTSAARNAQPQVEEDFFEKNKRLNRPMSPHLTIYQIQITTALSVTHRGTGLALSGLTSGFAIGMLALPGSFPHYLGVLESAHFGPALITSVKFLLAFPFVFHFANGIRHLAWDLGKGFQMKSVYKTGYAVLGTSVVLAAILAAL